MKRGRLLLGLISLWFIAVMPAYADEAAERLESIVIDTFDDPSERVWLESGREKREKREWVAVGSKFATKEGDVQFPVKAFPEVWPSALFDRNTEGQTLRSLGIHGKFDRKGFNYVEIYPVKDDGTGKLIHAPYSLPGIAKMIDIWVWGSLYNYTLEVHLRDFQGIPHVLEMGSLWYKGWKNLTVRVPSGIRQTQNQIPNYQGMQLTKFVVRTNPNERVDNFYVYFDNLKVLSDMHLNPFDGRELADPAFLQKIWNPEGAN
ncbi:MAG: hypothetical protein A2Z96_02440 [Spirochaetes bacterium GWB1_48_6]|nr:MAG: hypothetical protein A2Z96_02440 [Spirochaetes bacterium GWB1_48_6]